MAQMALPGCNDPTVADLLHRHRGAALQLLRRLAPREAEDLLQETLARAWRYRAAFLPAASRDGGRGWLLQTAFRTYLDHRRRHRDEGATDPAVLAEMLVDQRAEGRCPATTRDELTRALQPLRPIERALVTGFHGHGCSLQELADRHGLPLNTVKSHLHRARERLATHHRENDDA